MSKPQQTMGISLEQLVIKQITIDLHIPVELIKAMVYLVCTLLVIIIIYYILIIIKIITIYNKEQLRSELLLQV